MKLPPIRSRIGSHLIAGQSTTSLALVSLAMLIAGCGGQEASVEQRLLQRQRERDLRQADAPLSFEEVLRDAEREFELDNYRAADLIIAKLLQEYPDNSEAILFAAKNAQALGDTPSAISLLETIPEDAPERPVALRKGAEWLAGASRYDEAIERFERLRETGEFKRRDLHALATLLNNSGRRMEAARVLGELLRDGDITELELFSLITLGSPFIDDALPKPDFYGELPLAALAEARVRRENDANEALEFAIRLRQAHPDSTQVTAFVARLLAEVQDWPSLRRVISERPEGTENEPEFWYAVGMLQQQALEHRQAVGCFRRAVSLDPTDRFSFLQMAKSLAVLGKPDLSARMQRCYERLDRTSALIRKIGLEPGTQEELAELAELLDEMKRPLEAHQWRLVAARQRGAIPSDLETLEQQRREILADVSSAGVETLLGGIDAETWPTPDPDSLQILPTPESADLNAAGAIRLKEVAAAAGLQFRYVARPPSDELTFLYQLNGGGIGVIDFDRDGWPDCYFAQSGGLPKEPEGSLPNQLFRNLSGVSFIDATPESGSGDQGFGQGVAVADLNQDGFEDLLVANIGVNFLYLNQGDGTFARQALVIEGESPEAFERWTTTIACGDLNGDGLPEVLMVNYSNDPEVFRVDCGPDGEACSPDHFRGDTDQLFSLQADATFEDQSASLEPAEAGHGFGAIIGNINQVPGNEALVVNDGDSNQFWLPDRPDNAGGQSDRPASFIDQALLLGLAHGVRGSRQGCMGVAHGDFDRNGMMDFHVSNYWEQPSDLYLQQQGGVFQNATMGRGVGTPSIDRVGWGTQACDLDRDGWLDLVVLNGHLVDQRRKKVPYRMSPQLFRGRPDRFDLIDPDAGEYWSQAALGRTLAMLDWNRDGNMDFVANHLDTPAALLENQTDSQNWIQIELVGVASERDAVGATVSIEVDDQRWTHWVVGGDGFLCHNESVVDFGVGDLHSPATVEIEWPSGTEQRFQGVALNARYLVVEGDPAVYPRFAAK